IGDFCRTRNGSGEQAPGGSKKLSPVESGVLARFLHARLLGERSNGVSSNVSDALYVSVTAKQATKIVFLRDSCGLREAAGSRRGGETAGCGRSPEIVGKKISGKRRQRMSILRPPVRHVGRAREGALGRPIWKGSTHALRDFERLA